MDPIKKERNCCNKQYIKGKNMKEENKQIGTQLQEALTKICLIRKSLDDVSASLVGQVNDDTLSYYNNLIKSFDYLIEKIKLMDESNVAGNILSKPFMNILLDHFVISGELSNRELSALSRAGIVTTKDLTYITPSQLYQVRGCGKSAINKIEVLCKKHSIDIGLNSDKIPCFQEGDTVISLIDKKMVGLREDYVKKGKKFIILSEVKGSLPYYRCRPIHSKDDNEFVLLTIGAIEKEDLV